jgi:multiple antibiotic resistance protein
MDRAERRETAIRACSHRVLYPCSCSALVAEVFLSALGIRPCRPFALPAGCCSSGWRSTWCSRSAHSGAQCSARRAIDKDHIKNVAVFPLAIPFMAGPGAIAAMVLLSNEAQLVAGWAGTGALVGVLERHGAGLPYCVPGGQPDRENC